MKQIISLDFLRGILVACSARDAVNILMYVAPINYKFSSIPPHLRNWVVIATSFIAAIYILVILLLILRPTSSSKLVFAILAGMFFLYLAFIGIFPKELNISLFTKLFFVSSPFITTAISLYYLIRLKPSKIS